MAQKFFTFRGETLELAHRAMREKLGDDALVVRTSTVTEGGILGLMGKTLYEITASAFQIGHQELGRPTKRAITPFERKYLMSGAASDDEFVPIAAPAKHTNSPAPPESAARANERRDAQETVAYFERLVRDAQERIGATPIGQTTSKRPGEAAKAAPGDAARGDAADIRTDLSKIREMLQVLFTEMPGAGLPAEYAPHYRNLLDRGVTRELAADLISAASTCDDSSLLRDQSIFRERLKMQIRKRIRTTGGIKLHGGRRVVALVGPTGVGKTTNLAKLAALFSVTEHAKVGLITADTYRVAATDHLRVYANIIGLEMKVVKSPQQATTALAAFADCDLVLMDTAGGSPFNEEQMGDVQAVLEGAGPHETVLLISAATPLEDMRNILERFACLRPTSLLFTKLDETRRYGALLSMAAAAGLPLSYFSIGQNVPDDIALAQAGMVADLALEDRDSGRASTKTA